MSTMTQTFLSNLMTCVSPWHDLHGWLNLSKSRLNTPITTTLTHLCITITTKTTNKKHLKKNHHHHHKVKHSPELVAQKNSPTSVSKMTTAVPSSSPKRMLSTVSFDFTSTKSCNSSLVLTSGRFLRMRRSLHIFGGSYRHTSSCLPCSWCGREVTLAASDEMIKVVV